MVLNIVAESIDKNSKFKLFQSVAVFTIPVISNPTRPP